MQEADWKPKIGMTFDNIEDAWKFWIDCPEKAKEIFRKSSDSGEHERAGNLYWKKCQEPDFKRVGDCFNSAGQYETAAEVYASGHLYSDCLNACVKGKLLDIGERYLQVWENTPTLLNHDFKEMKRKFVETCQGGSASGSCDILKGSEAFMKKIRDSIISDNLDAAKEFRSVKGEVTKKQLFEIANFIFRPLCQEIKMYSKLTKKLEKHNSGKLFVECLNLNESREVRYQKFLEAMRKGWGDGSDWRSVSCGPFLNLMERLMIEISAWNGVILGSKKAFSNWLACQGDDEAVASLSMKHKPDLESAYGFFSDFFDTIWAKQTEILIDWLEKGSRDVRRMMISLSILLHLNTGRYGEWLNNFLRNLDVPGISLNTANILIIAQHLGSYADAGLPVMTLESAAQIFNDLHEPLVIVKLSDSTSKIVPQNLNKAFFIDANLCSDREKILEIINPEIVEMCAAGNGKEVKSAADKGKKKKSKKKSKHRKF